ncbi:Response regulator ArlR [Marinibacterium anthonyi]|nr:Response regulator ArlR [Marinibacterium anthonyi]
MNAARVLLVEDDVGVARMLERGLAQAGYAVDWSRTLQDAVARAGQLSHDLVVLDRMLPDGDGADLCAALRKFGHPARVCMLTARDALEDKLRGFDAGADDYLVKPFEFDELLARLHALGRRGPAERPELRRVEVDRTLVLGHRKVKLTKREWALIQPLLDHRGQTVRREDLLAAAWGGEDAVSTNAVDVYVGYLRRKLAELDGDVRIDTIRGEGFRLNE